VEFSKLFHSSKSDSRACCQNDARYQISCQ
jgi:hypothetical protein